MLRIPCNWGRAGESGGDMVDTSSLPPFPSPHRIPSALLFAVCGALLALGCLFSHIALRWPHWHACSHTPPPLLKAPLIQGCGLGPFPPTERDTVPGPSECLQVTVISKNPAFSSWGLIKNSPVSISLRSLAAELEIELPQ